MEAVTEREVTCRCRNTAADFPGSRVTVHFPGTSETVVNTRDEEIIRKWAVPAGAYTRSLLSST